MLSLAVIAAAFASTAVGLNNGVGKLPKMGYNTFNNFGCSYDHFSAYAQVEAMVKHGLVEAGYNTILIDDCYSLKNRSAEGKLVADPEKFPYGIKNFTDSVKALGVSASAYSNAGYKTCAGHPGSYGYEKQDLETFAEWGFDYLKYDNCYIPFDNVTQENVYGRYERMANAIAEFAEETNSTPFQHSLCEWGWQQPSTWASRFGQSWRITGDIKPWWSTLAAIIDAASFTYWSTNFYGRIDMDILEVGNTGQGTPPGNLTYDEAKSHFTAWTLLKSPLFLSTDLTNVTEETIEILTNKDLLKINQDPNVGESISPFRWGINPDYTSNVTHPAQYWSGNSSYGVVFMVLNTLDTEADMFFNLTESWAIRAGRQYSVYDLWSHTDNGTAIRNISLTLPPHGVSALLLNDDGPEPEGIEPYCGVWYQCSFPNGTYYSN
ncbi:hypothetical protein AJ79_08655 [Helicocarpus griseus UAMH5409]|uniref:Alpha-galactosidase n=1 Tax=Helicocarpus griseus UAMH5409 TaxID=1447875 RepID=A0A2B7WR45_9EURO|nr:hypothetical protein AJ79_08655 [Helicocarpus griseus UAMH5409]